jgi:hypothetical protein
MTSNNYLEFLGEVESIFKTALAHESRPKGGGGGSLLKKTISCKVLYSTKNLAPQILIHTDFTEGRFYKGLLA